MTNLDSKIADTYGKKLRIRVCGICIELDKVLLVRHRTLGKKGVLWAPPGGGMHYNEDAMSALKREFKEETGLSISIERFLFVHEYMEVPLHSVELFFLVKRIGGELKTGYDPEVSDHDQIITDVAFCDLKELKKDQPESLHDIFQHFESLEVLINQKGYFKFH